MPVAEKRTARLDRMIQVAQLTVAIIALIVVIL